MPERFVKARFKSPERIALSEPLHLELAVTPDEKSRGLMGRQSLPRNHGMLFVFTSANRWGFWMRETFIPLDIAWLSEAGVVVELGHLTPRDEKMKVPRMPARYAIEVNAGVLKQLDVKVGDQLLIFSADSKLT